MEDEIEFLEMDMVLDMFEYKNGRIIVKLFYFMEFEIICTGSLRIFILFDYASLIILFFEKWNKL